MSLRTFLLFLILIGNPAGLTWGVSACQIRPVDFDGWKAQQISNRWVTLTVVPQLGGRLMQVAFGDHAYLFVNPQLKGKYFPPSAVTETKKWFNYGGDKIWPLPEGSQDAGHWPGPISDPLDDGEYTFSILSQSAECKVRLEGPSDPHTGLQYAREISLGSDSPQITFHAVMKNSSDHPIRWSMQSVTQYDTASADSSNTYNRNFWAYSPINPTSAYDGGFRVRLGPVDDPAYSVKDGLFALHWLYLQREAWVDSTSGWLAVVDASAGYAMLERFSHLDAEYPGEATVIFYTNGPALAYDDQGMPFLTPAKPDDLPYYMEAEVNSPMVLLKPDETYALDTKWFPTRFAGRPQSANEAGVASSGLTALRSGNSILLSGTFGVFFAGKLNAHLFDAAGVEVGLVPLQSVSPLDIVVVKKELSASPSIARISIRLTDEQGIDRGSLDEAPIPPADHAP